MKIALLATKEEQFNEYYDRLSIGDAGEYETTRTAIILKLEAEDKVWIRVLGTGDVVLKCRVTVVNVGDINTVHFIVEERAEISTKEMYETYSVKAGAEASWIRGESDGI